MQACDQGKQEVDASRVRGMSGFRVSTCEPASRTWKRASLKGVKLMDVGLQGRSHDAHGVKSGGAR